MKLGAPSAMNKMIDANSLGQRGHEIETTNDEMLELMGLSTSRKQKQKSIDTNEMAHRVYTKCCINSEGMNARQAFLKCKQGTPSFEIPKVRKCHNEPPDEINVYSDGSLINTRTNSFKLAGAGVWWPNRKDSGICVRNNEPPLSEAELDLAYARRKDDGIELSVAITGMGGSSTRAEIAAGIIAMAADCEIHMGTDSKAFMDRAQIILQMIKDQRKPKRPWSTQKDCDLWKIFIEMAKIKGGR